MLNLKNKKARRVKLALDLIEICSKNGNLQFHKVLSEKDFSDQFLLLLKRVIIFVFNLYPVEKRKVRNPDEET